MPHAKRFQRLRDAIDPFWRACHDCEPVLAAPAEFYQALTDCMAAAALGDAEVLADTVRAALPVFTRHGDRDGSPMERVPMLAGAWGRLLTAYGQMVDQQSQLLVAAGD